MSPGPSSSGGSGPGKTSYFEEFMIGGVAAGVSKTVSAPLERIKLLIQNQGESAAITKPYKGKSILI